MINPDLERRYADCAELVDAWKSYLEFYNSAVKSEEFSATVEMEQTFMDTKARIAMLHDSFMASLKHDQNVAQNMLAIVNRSITLRHLRGASHADQKKIEIEWHEVYLLLNETVSYLAEERERLADRNEIAHRIGKIQERIFVNTKAFFRSVYFKAIVGLVIVAAVAVLLLTQTFEPLRTTDATRGFYTVLLDFRRDVLGFPAPYGELAKLEERKLADNRLPSGYTRRNQTERNRDQVVGAYSSIVVAGQQGDQFLRGADDYMAVTLQASQDDPPIMTDIFYWFEVGPALSFAIAFEQAAMAGDDMSHYFANAVTVFQEENAVVIMTNGSREDRAQVRREVFGR